LSFAQFERELIGERTRDKMSAARKKGKWVGGTPLLGYDIDPAGGRLIMNQAEGERVREIFALYHRHRSLAVVVAELRARVWTNKTWKSRRGIRHTGKPFSKVSLRMLLSNATYQGKVRYHGVIYPGEHPALIDESLWNEVNHDFQNPIEKKKQHQPHQPQNAPLTRLLFCNACQVPMIATYSAQGKRRYRYYVCQTAKQKGWKFCPTKSVSASLLESSLLIEFRSKLESAEVRQRLPIPDSDWHALVQGDFEVMERVLPMVEQVRYDGSSGVVSVQLRDKVYVGNNECAFEYKIPRQRGRTLPSFRMQPASETLTRPPRLARLLALAHKLEALVRSGKVKDFAELARLARISSARIGQIVLLAQLAPAIQEHILFLPTEQAMFLGERQLREIARLPRWDHQQALFERLLGTFVTEPI
jgi:hypothetical protein